MGFLYWQKKINNKLYEYRFNLEIKISIVAEYTDITKEDRKAICDVAFVPVSGT